MTWVHPLGLWLSFQDVGYADEGITGARLCCVVQASGQILQVMLQDGVRPFPHCWLVVVAELCRVFTPAEDGQQFGEESLNDGDISVIQL